ncbi:cytochrome c oxidase subunit III [uncultured bacterium]|nr:cytochrome c oxidase subunit III [uncultured bacterium]
MNGTTAHSHRDYTGSKIGMWLFLFTEFFLFFGPILLYSIFRFRYPQAFIDASLALDTGVGVFNTALLLTSSLTMALSITAMQRGKKGTTLVLMGATVLAGAVFLVNKYFEWGAKISHGVYPGGEALEGVKDGGAVFYGLYFFATGLHGIHVLAGMVIITVAALLVHEGRINSNDFVKLENTGLYWHLVDVIWIYLFPIFYLVR